MQDHDSIIGILNRLNSPTHDAPISQLQLAAMQNSVDQSDARRQVEFSSLTQKDIFTLRDTLQQLELDAKSIMDLHQQIEQRKKAGREYLHRATAALAPINRFPAEVLARIFVLGRHLELNFSPRMSWVAQRWRNVALSTPELWNTIPLTGEARVGTYLDRSGSMPLDIQADLRTYRVNVFEVSQCMKILEPHRLRWRNVKILLEDHDQSQPILRQIEGICTDIQQQSCHGSLDTVYFGIANPDDQVSSHHSSSLRIPAIPSVRVIELLAVDLFCSPEHDTAGFHQVLRLSLADARNMHLKSHFFNALSTMLNLVELVLDQCDFIMPSLTDDVPRINLEKLEMMQLSLMPDEVVNLILKKVQTPNLRRLELLSHELDGPSRILDWEAIRNSYAHISVLKLYNITSWATPFLLQWLTKLSQLSILSVKFEERLSPYNAERSSEQVLQVLADVRNQCCPKLHTLDIGTLAPDGVTTLRAVLDSRPLLKSGKVSIVLRPQTAGHKRQDNDLAWIRAHMNKFTIRVSGDESDDETTDDEE